MNTLLKLKGRKLYILPTVCNTIITKSIADEGERTPIIHHIPNINIHTCLCSVFINLPSNTRHSLMKIIV